MPGQFQNLIPVEYRGFRQSGVVSTITGSAAANDGVVAFANEPTLLGRFPLDTFVDVSSVADSATLGTSYNFTQRGIYQVRAIFPLTVAGTTPLALAITLDSLVAELDATSVPTPLVAAVRGYSFEDGLADQASTANPTAVIPITDTLAGSPTLGIMRLLANSGAGAAPTAAGVTIAQCTIWCECTGDLAG